MSWNFSKSGKDIQIFQINVYLKSFNNTSLVKDHKQGMLFLLLLPLTYTVSKQVNIWGQYGQYPDI